MLVPNPPFYALLIGIDEYINTAEFSPLGGCANDVWALADLLYHEFGVPDDPSYVRVLTNADATHAAIKQVFRDHLISAARAWSEAGRLDPPRLPVSFQWAWVPGH